MNEIEYAIMNFKGLAMTVGTANIKRPYQLAVEALEKQIARKPIEEGLYYYVCVTCERLIEKREQAHGKIFIRYCKWCGQKLDWSDAR